MWGQESKKIMREKEGVARERLREREKKVTQKGEVRREKK